MSVGQNIALAVDDGQSGQGHGKAAAQSSELKHTQKNPLAELSNFITKISGSKPTRQKMNLLNSHHLRQQVLLKLVVPRVGLIMKYDTSQHYLATDLSDLCCELVARRWDIQVNSSIAQLTIRDTIRSEAQRSVVWNDIGECPHHQLLTRRLLIHPSDNSKVDTRIVIQVSKAFDKRSPLFDVSGASAGIQISSLLVRLDSNTILHLRPFLDSFLAYSVMHRPSRTDLKEDYHGKHQHTIPPLNVAPKVF